MSADAQGPVLVCLGTRPEAIKLAPVIIELRQRGQEVVVLSTGQHDEMLRGALGAFDIAPDCDLGLMRERQTLAELTGRAIPAIDRVLAQLTPSTVVVQGDTLTAMCGALASFYRQIPVAHVEAGLRTDNKYDPFPEEINRRIIGQLADHHFCATDSAAANLNREGLSAAGVHITGNTVIDAARLTAERLGLRPQGRDWEGACRVLVTLHRRESQGSRQREICLTIAELAQSENIHVTFPVHLSPSVREVVFSTLSGHDNIELCDPFDYEQMVSELTRTDVVMSDSGGLQEEAPAFDVPVMVLRENTERPEGVAAGCSVLCGTDPSHIHDVATRLLHDRDEYERMAQAANPYGDGHAAQRIADILTPLDTAPLEAWARELEPAH